MQAEPLRFLATGPANRHVKQDDPILLADHPIWLAKDEIVTVPAEECHDTPDAQAECRFLHSF